MRDLPIRDIPMIEFIDEENEAVIRNLLQTEFPDDIINIIIKFQRDEIPATPPPLVRQYGYHPNLHHLDDVEF